MMRKKILLTALALILCACLSGCFAKTVDELYDLPKHSDAYHELQQAIDEVMTDGAQYAAPVSGDHQQSVQLADLNGDGDDEAVVFLRKAGDMPLVAHIFDEVDGKFQSISTIVGSGAAFESVEYVQLDGRPGVELLIGRQLSDQVLQAMSVHTLSDGNAVELMAANYSEYAVCDLDDDGRKDIFLLRFDPEQRTGVAEIYRCRDGRMEREPESSMSAGVESVKRIVTGYLTHGVPAVFVASVYESDSIITDVFAFHGGKFRNVSTSDKGVSAQTVRNHFLYAADINSDGLIELPQPVTLPQSEDAAEQYCIIRWYNLDLNARQTVRMTTCHNFSGGWYMVLPEAWEQALTISRSEEVAGVRGIVFSQWDEQSAQAVPIFTVYAFSGEGRNTLGSSDGRLILAEKGDVTYAAELGQSPLAASLTQEALKEMFHFIHIDWNSGDK